MAMSNKKYNRAVKNHRPVPYSLFPCLIGAYLQVKGGSRGQSSDVIIHATRIEEMNDNLIKILAENYDRS